MIENDQRENPEVVFSRKLISDLKKPLNDNGKRSFKSRFVDLEVNKGITKAMVNLMKIGDMKCENLLELDLVVQYQLELSRTTPLAPSKVNLFIRRELLQDHKELSKERAERRKFKYEEFLSSQFAFVWCVDTIDIGNVLALVENSIQVHIDKIIDLSLLEKAYQGLRMEISKNEAPKNLMTYIVFVTRIIGLRYFSMLAKQTDLKFNPRVKPDESSMSAIEKNFSTGEINEEELGKFLGYFQSIPVRKRKEQRSSILKKLFPTKNFTLIQCNNLMIQDSFGNRLLDLVLYGMSSGVLNFGDRVEFLENVFSNSQFNETRPKYIKDLRLVKTFKKLVRSNPETKALRKELPHPIYSPLSKCSAIAQHLKITNPTTEYYYSPDASSQRADYKDLMDSIRLDKNFPRQNHYIRKVFAIFTDYTNDEWKENFKYCEESAYSRYLNESLPNHVSKDQWRKENPEYDKELGHLRNSVAAKIRGYTMRSDYSVRIYQYYLKCRSRITEKEFLASEAASSIKESFHNSFKFQEKVNFVYQNADESNKLPSIDFTHACMVYYLIFEDSTPYQKILLDCPYLLSIGKRKPTLDRYYCSCLSKIFSGNYFLYPFVKTQFAKIAVNTLINNHDEIFNSSSIETVNQISAEVDKSYLKFLSKNVFHRIIQNRDDIPEAIDLLKGFQLSHDSFNFTVHNELLKKNYCLTQDLVTTAMDIMRRKYVLKRLARSNPETKALRKELPHPIYSPLSKCSAIAQHLKITNPTTEYYYSPDASSQRADYKDLMDSIRLDKNFPRQNHYIRKVFAIFTDYTNDEWKENFKYCEESAYSRYLNESLPNHVSKDQWRKENPEYDKELGHLRNSVAAKIRGYTMRSDYSVRIYQYYLKCRSRITEKEFLASEAASSIKESFHNSFKFQEKVNFVYQNADESNKLPSIDFTHACMVYYLIFEDSTPYQKILLDCPYLLSIGKRKPTLDRWYYIRIREKQKKTEHDILYPFLKTQFAKIASNTLISNLDEIFNSPSINSVIHNRTEVDKLYLKLLSKNLFPRTFQNRDDMLEGIDLLKAVSGSQWLEEIEKFKVAKVIDLISSKQVRRANNSKDMIKNIRKVVQLFLLLKAVGVDASFLSIELLKTILGRPKFFKPASAKYLFEALMFFWINKQKYGEVVRDFSENVLFKLEGMYSVFLYWGGARFITMELPKAKGNHQQESYNSWILTFIDKIRTEKKEGDIISLKNNRYLKERGVILIEHMHKSFNGDIISTETLIELFNLIDPVSFRQVTNAPCFSNKQKLEILLDSKFKIPSNKLPEVYEFMKIPGMTKASLSSICMFYDFEYSSLSPMKRIKFFQSLSPLDFTKTVPKLFAKEDTPFKLEITVSAISSVSLRRFATCINAAGGDLRSVLTYRHEGIPFSPEGEFILLDYIQYFWKPMLSLVHEGVKLKEGYYNKQNKLQKAQGSLNSSHFSLFRQAIGFYYSGYTSILDQIEEVDKLFPNENIKQALMSFLEETLVLVEQDPRIKVNIMNCYHEDFNLNLLENPRSKSDRQLTMFPAINLKFTESDFDGYPKGSAQTKKMEFNTVKDITSLKTMVNYFNGVNSIKLINSIPEKSAILKQIASDVSSDSISSHLEVFAGLVLSFFVTDGSGSALYSAVSSSTKQQQMLFSIIKTCLNIDQIKSSPGYQAPALSGFQKLAIDFQSKDTTVFTRPLNATEKLYLYGSVDVLKLVGTRDMPALSSNLNLMQKVNKQIAENPSLISSQEFKVSGANYTLSSTLVKQIFSNEKEGHLNFQKIGLAIENLKNYSKIWTPYDNTVVLSETFTEDKLKKVLVNATGKGENLQPNETTYVLEFDVGTPLERPFFPFVKFMSEGKVVSFILGTRVHSSYSELYKFLKDLKDLSKEVKTDYGEEELISIIKENKDPFSTECLKNLIPTKHEIFHVPEADYKYNFKEVVQVIKMEFVVEEILKTSYQIISQETITKNIISSNSNKLGFKTTNEWFDKVYGPLPVKQAPNSKGSASKKK